MVSLAALMLGGLLSLQTLSLAQAPLPPKPFTGTLVSISGDSVSLKSADGQLFTVQMTPGWTASANRAADSSAIKPGDFIATTNVPIDASTGKSTEVRVLEPGYRPEQGTHPISATNSNMMTHGTVDSVKSTDAGAELQVTYPGGSRRIIVPPGVRVTVSDPVDRGALKPGVTLGGVTRVGSDGVARASRLQPSNP